MELFNWTFTLKSLKASPPRLNLSSVEKSSIVFVLKLFLFLDLTSLFLRNIVTFEYKFSCSNVCKKTQIIIIIFLHQSFTYIESALENDDADYVVKDWIFQGEVDFETIFFIHNVKGRIESTNVWKRKYSKTFFIFQYLPLGLLQYGLSSPFVDEYVLMPRCGMVKDLLRSKWDSWL